MTTKKNQFLFAGYTYNQEKEFKIIREKLRLQVSNGNKGMKK